MNAFNDMQKKFILHEIRILRIKNQKECLWDN